MRIDVTSPSRDHRNGDAGPIPERKLARFANKVQRSQQLVEVPNCAGPESCCHYEFSFRAWTLDHPRDSQSVAACVSAAHIEGAECVAPGREQLEVVG